jgi:predicted RNase H-like nuclease (RuvC/YqgF family)
MALMKEKQEIEDSVNEDDEKSVLQYNENVKKLNLKIKQYKTEKKFLQAEIEKYNHAIKQSALN